MDSLEIVSVRERECVTHAYADACTHVYAHHTYLHTFAGSQQYFACCPDPNSACPEARGTTIPSADRITQRPHPSSIITLFELDSPPPPPPQLPSTPTPSPASLAAASFLHHHHHQQQQSHLLSSLSSSSLSSMLRHAPDGGSQSIIV